MNILVINAGSSSIKYQLFEMDCEKPLCRGIVERIGFENAIVTHRCSKAEPVKLVEPISDHEQAVSLIIRMLTHQKYGAVNDISTIAAVGHRLAHGAEKLFEPVIIDACTLKMIKSNIGLAPIHMPHMVKGIEVFRKLMPDTPMAAVFDTAFHQTMPKKAYIYPIPYRYYKQYDIRRFGFHGTSHQYVSSRAARMLEKPISALRTITCHLGNGSSLAAVKHGISIDTSMGFTPVAGLPMGTRCGDIDVSIFNFLIEKEGLSADEVNDMLNTQSGLMGISGVSSDLRELLQKADEGHVRAALAIDVLCYSVKKLIGAYAAAMGGVDCIVFTGGIGENAAAIRQKCCEDLEFLGIQISAQKNSDTQHIRISDAVISSDSSRVKVLVIHTNEELMIARETLQLLSAVNASGQEH